MVPEVFIKQYIAPSCNGDERIMKAFREVDRREFMERGVGEFKAYHDIALPIGFGQTISQPSLVARMLWELAPEKEMNCLEVGAGSGFVAALLSKLAKTVYALEYLPELAEAAAARLSRLYINNARVIHADGSKGYEHQAPYDRIIVSCGAQNIPQALTAQLTDGGIMIIPLNGTLTKAVKREGKLTLKGLALVAFVDFINS